MILTITLNPSVDIQYLLDELIIDDVNRIQDPIKTAGGKGLNVARVLRELGEDVSATGFLGGALGEFISEEIKKIGINDEFYPINDETRNCVAILHGDNQTEINEGGPKISKEEEEGFLTKIDELLDNVKVVAMSGSLPKGVDTDIYEEIVKLAKDKNVLTIVDTSGEALRKTVEGEIKPDFIKPNLSELSALLGKEVTNDFEQLKETLNEGNLKNIENIVVSLGADGAFAKLNGKFYKADIPKIEVVNPVGSGDSTVSGIIYGLEKDMSDRDLLKSAMTCGMLNSMEEQTGHINKDNFDEIFNRIEIREV